MKTLIHILKFIYMVPPKSVKPITNLMMTIDWNLTRVRTHLLDLYGKCF